MIDFFSRMILQRSPLLLVLLGGIVFAIARWKRHPKISFFTLLGLLLYLFRVFSFAALSYSIPKIRESMQLSFEAAGHLYTGLSVLNDLTFSGIIIIFVVVAFAERTPATPANTERNLPA